MNKFNYKFKPYLYVIIILAAALSATGLGFNIYRLIASRYEGPNGLFATLLCIVISAAILVLTLSILICARYEVNGQYFILRWGVLVNKTKINSINTLVYNSTTRVLAIVYDNDAVMVISSVGNEALDIVDSLRRKNPSIMFESISNDKEYKKPDDKSKK